MYAKEQRKNRNPINRYTAHADLCDDCTKKIVKDIRWQPRKRGGSNGGATAAPVEKARSAAPRSEAGTA
jgi:hypothetical protein